MLHPKSTHDSSQANGNWSIHLNLFHLGGGMVITSSTVEPSIVERTDASRGVVAASRNRGMSIRTERNALDEMLMPFKALELSALGQIPEMDANQPAGSAFSIR
jgi:hypothetical protein